MLRCNYNSSPGWRCSRGRNHDGPCALRRRNPDRTRVGCVYAALLLAGTLITLGMTYAAVVYQYLAGGGGIIGH